MAIHNDTEVIMRRTISMCLGAASSVVLLVLALWAWRREEDFAALLGAHNLRIAGWSAKCTAVALVAAGEAILLLLVIRPAFKRDAFTSILAPLAVLVFMLSAASAVALGLAGR
jgi:hypothetical protein